MKIGDLVELSSRGKRLNYCKKFVGLVGMVCEVDSSSNFSEGKEVEWYYVNWCGGGQRSPHLRRDLKYVSKRK
jgi:hypothetical protein